VCFWIWYSRVSTHGRHIGALYVGPYALSHPHGAPPARYASQVSGRFSFGTARSRSREGACAAARNQYRHASCADCTIKPIKRPTPLARKDACPLEGVVLCLRVGLQEPFITGRLSCHPHLALPRGVTRRRSKRRPVDRPLRSVAGPHTPRLTCLPLDSGLPACASIARAPHGSERRAPPTDGSTSGARARERAHWPRL